MVCRALLGCQCHRGEREQILTLGDASGLMIEGKGVGRGVRIGQGRGGGWGGGWQGGGPKKMREKRMKGRGRILKSRGSEGCKKGAGHSAQKKQEGVRPRRTWGLQMCCGGSRTSLGRS